MLKFFKSLFKTNELREVNSKRVVIVHVHIFKNAGSTFDWILKKNFGRDFVDHRDDKSMIDGGSEYLKQFLIDNPTVKAISSHHIYFNPKEVDLPNTEIIPLYILRQPIERVMSVYKFEKKQSNITPGAIHAKKYNLNDYVEWRMNPDIGSTLRNSNIRYCAGLGRGEVSEREFLAAKENLENTNLVAIVDRFDESMQICEKELTKHFPSFDIGYEKQNINQKESLSSEEKIKEVEDNLEKETLQKLYNNNKYDLELYDFINSLLDERLKNEQ